MERLRLALSSALSKLHISFMVYSSLADPLFLRELEPVAQVKLSGGARGLGAAAQPRSSCQDRNTSWVIQHCLCPIPEQGAAMPGAVYQLSARQLVLGTEFAQQHLLPMRRRWTEWGARHPAAGPSLGCCDVQLMLVPWHRTAHTSPGKCGKWIARGCGWRHSPDWKHSCFKGPISVPRCMLVFSTCVGALARCRPYVDSGKEKILALTKSKIKCLGKGAQMCWRSC